MAKQGAKILVFDLETAPLIANVWALWDQNVALNQIVSDWHLLSWAAKWIGNPKVMYMDQRNAKDMTDDSKILAVLWKLLDEADIVVAQNGQAFDCKKVNARFIMAGMNPPSPYKIIDTMLLAKKHFAFTSNKLEYMSDKLCKKHKKLKHAKFAGFELWAACLKGDLKAWEEMERYNKADVLATEELYEKLAPWGIPGVDGNVFHDAIELRCRNIACGNATLKKRGRLVNRSGVFQKYQCSSCGAWCSDTGAAKNLLSKEKMKSIKGK